MSVIRVSLVMLLLAIPFQVGASGHHEGVTCRIQGTVKSITQRQKEEFSMDPAQPNIVTYNDVTMLLDAGSQLCTFEDDQVRVLTVPEEHVYQWPYGKPIPEVLKSSHHITATTQTSGDSFGSGNYLSNIETIQ